MREIRLDTHPIAPGGAGGQGVIKGGAEGSAICRSILGHGFIVLVHALGGIVSGRGGSIRRGDFILEGL